MTKFIDYKDNTYTYEREGKKYSIASGLLISLFKTHGYCVDPVVKTGVALNSESVESLRYLAHKYNDVTLLSTITTISKGKAPSPRMINDGIMNEITLNERKRFEHLNIDNRTHTLSILRIILNIGLYLAGWKGSDEPYITAPRPVYDMVRVEMIIQPLIQSLYTNPNYPLVKNFPIMGYYRQDLLRPTVLDPNLNVDHCLSRIGVYSDYQQCASYLISTAYYYITTITSTPLPMLEPLIRSLATTS